MNLGIVHVLESDLVNWGTRTEFQYQRAVTELKFYYWIYKFLAILKIIIDFWERRDYS